MKLSVAIATHNEEKNILRTLESVYDFADEIVIVDGSSTDKTVKVIKTFDRDGKIKIFSEKNPPMFHINKQKAIERCKGEWILQLDADEVVSPELRKEIAQLLNGSIAENKTIEQSSNETMTQAPLAYWLPRLNYFLGKPLKKGGQYPDYTIRLYKNGVAKFPCKSVHENVDIKINNQFQPIITNPDSVGNQLQPQIDYLKSDLLHFPYPTFAEYLRKWKLYCALEAENLKKQGVQPTLQLTVNYLLLKPASWFFLTYFRHLGILDGIPGFVFSLFSSIRYWLIYFKLREKM